LGNPGPAYEKTRHNIGRRIVEALAENIKIRWKDSKSLRSQWAETEARDLILAFPSSYMNESGGAVKLLVEHFKIDFQSNLLVVIDDAALPFGRLRLRLSGSDGGHKGLRSIETALGSREYARLRVGVGPSAPVKTPLEKYVLAPFTRSEEEKLGKGGLERLSDSCLLWAKEAPEKAMNEINRPSF
jgi:PTH1 family peptidyl-tRNA hydrolase